MAGTDEDFDLALTKMLQTLELVVKASKSVNKNALAPEELKSANNTVSALLGTANKGNHGRKNQVFFDKSHSSDAETTPNDSPKNDSTKKPAVKKAEHRKNTKMTQDLAAELNALTSHDNNQDDDSKFQISVNSKFRMNWDVMLMMLIVYVCFVAPMRIGFNFNPSGFIVGLDVTIDILFLIDIVLNFHTTYIDDDSKEEVHEPKIVAEHYLKTDFVLDAISSVPVQLIELTGGLKNSESLGFLKLFRIFKLVRAMRAGDLFKKLEKNLNANPAVFRMIKFVCIFFLMIHLLACAYAGLILSGHKHGPYTAAYFGDELSLSERYSASFHFSLAAASGNNMVPEDTVTEWFFSFCLLLGFVINATIIGSATNLLANLDATAVAKKAQIDGINEYLRFRKVPQQLQHKIQTYYEYLWDSGKSSYNQSLLVDLPEKLRVLLNLTLKKSLIAKVPLFKALSPPAVIAVVQKLRHLIVLPDELVVAQGEEADSMFFISRGSVRIYVNSNNKDVYLVTLGEGSFFGEIALLGKGALRSANVRALSFCELEVLYRGDFEGLLDAFPRFKQAVENLSKARLRVSDSVAQQGKAGNKLGIDPDENYRLKKKKKLLRAIPLLAKLGVGKSKGDAHGQEEGLLDRTGSIGLQKDGKEGLFENIMKNQQFLSIQTASHIFKDKDAITSEGLRKFEGVVNRVKVVNKLAKNHGNSRNVSGV